jgi:hypothetical protein
VEYGDHRYLDPEEVRNRLCDDESGRRTCPP